MADLVKAGFWYCKESQPRSNASTYFTHLFCAFADISATYQVNIPSEFLETFENFTRKNSPAKTLMSIGGIDSDPSTFASMARLKPNRQVFINSSIEKARSYNFNGLDLFWPCWKYQPTAEDMKNLGLLLDEWREAVVTEANNKTPLLLSATVFYTSKMKISDSEWVSYPVDAISKSLDWINVRAYGFYDPKSSPTRTGPPAALANRGNQPLSGESGIDDWIQAVHPKQLVLGLPFVGFEWLLEDPNQHQIFAPAKGAVPHGSDGMKLYQTIRDFITNQNFKQEFNKSFVTDYCYHDYKWIGYDDTESIKNKIHYASQKKQLLGYFAWHVYADDSIWTLSETASNEWGSPESGGSVRQQ